MWKWLHWLVVTDLLVMSLTAVLLGTEKLDLEALRPLTCANRPAEVRNPNLWFQDKEFTIFFIHNVMNPEPENVEVSVTQNFVFRYVRYGSEGFRDSRGNRHGTIYHILTFSWVVPAILSGIYPAIFFIRNYRRRRVCRDALKPCDKCGYDLRGNESGVCPECGEAVEAIA